MKINPDDLENAALFVCGILALYIGVALLGLTIGITTHVLRYFGIDIL